MADDAFALSPINARPALPTEADYDAICGAFMETARGRWFLGEYARRNRNADTAMVLEAVGRMEALLAKQKGPERPPPELIGTILDAIAATRAQILEGLPATDSSPTLAPIKRAADLLRDVAWTLRESGAELRVCDLLDAQASAIADGCARVEQHAATTDPREAIAAALDALTSQVSALLGAEATTGVAPNQSAARAMRPTDPGPVATAAPAAATPTAPAEPVATQAATPEQPLSDSAAAIVLETAVPVESWGDLEVIESIPAADVQARPFVDADVAVAASASPDEDVPAPTPAEDAEAQAIAADKKTSLGRTLLEAGTLTAAMARTEPLAAIRRMSQAERIAFFT